ncbi:ATP-dependent Clp protease proteolytic subunit [bacterium]|nr:ATP-dependent Clp protease proteolytic subunit [bacterium]
MEFSMGRMVKDRGDFEVSPVVRGVFNRPTGQILDFYLNSTIGSPEDYAEWNQILRSSGEQDVVYLHINCYGGQALTAVQLMRAISESRATVVASVEGACMSAATFLFLMADVCEISDHSIFMFHNFSGGTIGKGNEMMAQVHHNDKWARGLMESIYKDFFTQEEIDSILEGKDYWLSPDEVTERLQKRNDLLEKQKIADETPEKPTRKRAKKA